METETAAIHNVLCMKKEMDWLWCLCVCTDKWSPALQIRTVLLSIQALLSAPNPDDPLANDVAEQWKKNESLAIETGNLLFCRFYIFAISYPASVPPSLPPSFCPSFSPSLSSTVE